MASGSSGPPVSTTRSNPSIGKNSRPGNAPKNATGQRKDEGWKHGTLVEGKSIECNYCYKVYASGGIHRFKHHLACTKKDVQPCREVPVEIRKQMWNIVCGSQNNLINNRTSTPTNEVEEVERKKRKRVEVPQPKNPNILKKEESSQSTINNTFKKKQKEETDLQVATFFYNNSIPINVVEDKEFIKMCEMIAQFGIGYKPPSFHDIKEKFLKKKVKATSLIMEEHREAWKKYGCTIMIDGSTDQSRGTTLKFLVNSPMGTFFLKSIDASDFPKTVDKTLKIMEDVVDRVGGENVVQIVTQNASNYKLAGEMLMQKRPFIYWTPCAAHCIDLMLEDFGRKLPLHKETIASGKKITTYIYNEIGVSNLLHHFIAGGDLIRPGSTSFATSYLCLGYLNENKRPLSKMFISRQWRESQFVKTKEGKFVENIVLDKKFWRNLSTCVKGVFPLLKVLCMVDSDENPAMGYIYEAMDQAKEQIQQAFNNIEKSYLPLWKIIDKWWDGELHRPLHAAGYYLNPMLHYQPNFQADDEVKHGMYACLKRMMNYDMHKVNHIDTQLEFFTSRKGLFGDEVAQRDLKTKTPTQWWESYGDEFPELQNFAIRVLSLTCSSLRCERDWRAFEMVHAMKSNRSKKKTGNDLVHVMANAKLSKKNDDGRKQTVDIEDINEDCDSWCVGEEKNAPEGGMGVDALDEDLIDIDDADVSGALAVLVSKFDVVNSRGNDGGATGEDRGDDEGDNGDDNRR